jgi:hypothetical protein
MVVTSSNLAKSQKVDYIEVSALNANHISDSFEMLARSVLRRLTDLPFEKKRLPQTSNTHLEKEKKANTGGGCC